MAATPHAELVIALQHHCLVAIRNCVLSNERGGAKAASAIAEAAHEIDTYLRTGHLSGLAIVLDELEAAVKYQGGVVHPSVFNSVAALRKATGLTS
jgi:hypothetical protein